MLEGAVMEFVKWFIAMVCIMFVATMTVFMFQINEVNSFQQEVNYQIERHGGLTDDALVALNKHAKENYNGALLKSDEYGADFLFESDGADPDVKSSGFYVQEIKENDSGDLQYNSRSNSEQARYGTPIKYAITRQIGNIGNRSFVKPVIIGESASRVRGVVDE